MIEQIRMKPKSVSFGGILPARDLDPRKSYNAVIADNKAIVEKENKKFSLPLPKGIGKKMDAKV